MQESIIKNIFGFNDKELIMDNKISFSKKKMNSIKSNFRTIIWKTIK